MFKVPKYVNIKEYYSKLYFLFNAYIAVTLLPFAFLYLDIDAKGNKEPILSGKFGALLAIVLFMICLGTFYLGIQKFKSKLKASFGIPELIKKLDNYYEASLTKFNFFMASACVSILGLYLSKHYIFIVTYMLVLAHMSIFRPTLKSISNHLRLSDAQSQVLKQNLPIN